jgi:hypothetical protein
MKSKIEMILSKIGDIEERIYNELVINDRPRNIKNVC